MMTGGLQLFTASTVGGSVGFHDDALPLTLAMDDVDCCCCCCDDNNNNNNM